MINLISDTVTKPTQAMLDVMFKAKVGDDVFGQDPTVNRLEAQAADLFGMENALFCPSGTMTNQIAIKLHTQPLDEVWCDLKSHIYQYETAGYSFHSGVGLRMVDSPDGILSVDDLRSLEHPVEDWLAKPSLIVLENTCNKGGGTCYNYERLQAIRDYSRINGLGLHIDGARIFNAIVAKKYSAKMVGNICDSISICLSKGLGAPVGSLLIGENQFIKQARRLRKVMGGGMRQTGYLAAAGIYAIENNIENLSEDHQKANSLYNSLKKVSFVDKLTPPETNILIFSISPSYCDAGQFCKKLEAQGIMASAFGKYQVRLVTHRDLSMDQIKTTCKVLESL